jgi:hypothetical protein
MESHPHIAAGCSLVLLAHPSAGLRHRVPCLAAADGDGGAGRAAGAHFGGAAGGPYGGWLGGSCGKTIGKP